MSEPIDSTDLKDMEYTFEQCKVKITHDGTITTIGECTLNFPEINAIADITTKIRNGDKNGQD